MAKKTNILVVSFNLIDESHNYSEVYQELRRSSREHKELSRGTFVVITEDIAAKFRDRFQDLLTEEDKIFVIECTNMAAWSGYNYNWFLDNLKNEK